MKYINNSDKLKKILNAITAENLSIILDFDKTITSAKSPDSWDVTALLLNESCKEKLNQIYAFYAPKELDYTLKYSEKNEFMIEWYTKCMDLYYNCGLTKQKLEKAVEISSLDFRKGAKEFLQRSCTQNIPVIILSAGIGNVIKEFLKSNNCLHENIYIVSNFIEFNSDGTMKKFDNSKMIHTLNKTLKNHLPEDWGKKLTSRKYKLLVGDLCEDENMVPKEDWANTVKVGMLNANIEENLLIYRKTFDIVLTETDANFENWGW